MNVLIFGLGLIGKKYVQTLKQSFPSFNIFAFRHKKNSSTNLDGITEIYEFTHLDSLKFDFAIIANPTHLHISTAIECANRGIHLLIEKPLDCSLNQLETLKQAIKKKNITSYVAYCQRFNPVIEYLKDFLPNHKPLHFRVKTTNHLPNWPRTEKHLNTYSASKGMGGGVVFDLSHEIDYCAYLFGSFTKLLGMPKKLSNITNDAPDTVDIYLETAQSTGNIHINYMGHIPQREIEIDFKDFSLKCFIKEHRIERFERLKKVDEIKFDQPYDNMFIAQLNYFVHNLGSQDLMNNIEEAQLLMPHLIAISNN